MRTRAKKRAVLLRYYAPASSRDSSDSEAALLSLGFCLKRFKPASGTADVTHPIALDAHFSGRAYLVGGRVDMRLDAPITPQARARWFVFRQSFLRCQYKWTLISLYPYCSHRT